MSLPRPELAISVEEIFGFANPFTLLPHASMPLFSGSSLHPFND